MGHHRPVAGADAGSRCRVGLRRLPVPLVPAAGRLLAGALTGLSAAIFDFVYWNAERDIAAYRLPYAALTIVSATVIAGAGALALTRALTRTGVLDRFPAARERTLI